MSKKSMKKVTWENKAEDYGRLGEARLQKTYEATVKRNCKANYELGYLRLATSLLPRTTCKHSEDEAEVVCRCSTEPVRGCLGSELLTTGTQWENTGLLHQLPDTSFNVIRPALAWRSEAPLLRVAEVEVDFGSILGRFWVDFGSILGRFWVDFGSILGRFWVGFGSVLGRFWVAFPLGSRHKRCQSP